MLLDGYEDVVNSASGEVGKRFTLEGGTTLVPQVQLAWSQMEDGSFTDSLGNDVTFADRETLTGRVGLAMEQAVDVPDWGSGKVYGFGNVHADLSGDQMVEVAGTELTQSGGGTWAELGAGFSLSPDGETNLFGEVSYRSAVANVEGSAVSGSLGWRVQW